MIRKLIQAFFALLIVVGGLLISKRLIKTAPEAKKVVIVKELPSVEIIEVRKSSARVVIKTQGEVVPSQQTALSAQVMGKILSVSPKYEIGETFEKNEVILTIDDVDYRAALANAKTQRAQANASLQEARLNLQIELTRAQQAKRDWKQLGQGKAASDLLLRKPQITSIEARIEAAFASIEQAKINIEKAERDVERTLIRAPYACRLEQKQVELGAVVTMGSPLCSIYKHGEAEVRLPISLEDIPFISLSPPQNSIPFLAHSSYGSLRKEWKGRIIRNENRIDPATRTAFVIGAFTNSPIPPVGSFVEVELPGSNLNDVYALPKICLRNQAQVIVITPENQISFRDVTVARTTQDKVYISAGLQELETVCVTPLSVPIEGAKVSIAN